MNFSLASLTGLFFLIVLQNANAQPGPLEFDYAEFERKSLLFELKKESGSFSSEIQAVFPTLTEAPEDWEDKIVNRLVEKFSFDLEIGEYAAGSENVRTKEITSNKLLYFSKLSLVYQTEEVVGTSQKSCQSSNLNDMIQYLQSAWAPKEVFDPIPSNPLEDYPILGKLIGE